MTQMNDVEDSAAATGMMPAGLFAGFGVTSAGDSEREDATTALTRAGAGGLSSAAVFGESSGMIAERVRKIRARHRMKPREAPEWPLDDQLELFSQPKPPDSQPSTAGTLQRKVDPV